MTVTVALTGATGFIGAAVAGRLAQSGCTVRALCRPASAPRLQGRVVQPVAGALEDADSLRQLVRGADAVVHCAGAVRGAGTNFRRVNVAGTARLAAIAAEQRPSPRFLLISSLAARQPELSPYAASKRQGEEALAGAGAMRRTVLRPPAVYGPGDRALQPLWRSLLGGVAPVLGPGGARFSLLYVDDLAEAVLRWLANGEDPNIPLELHDGRPGGYAWPDVIAVAARMRGAPVRAVPVPAGLLRLLAGLNLIGARLLGYAPMLTPGKVRELRHPDWVCDNAAVTRALGWTPRITLEAGLRRTLGCVADLPN